MFVKYNQCISILRVDSLVQTLINQAHHNEQQLLLIQEKNAQSAADLEKILHRIKTMEVDAGDLETGSVHLFSMLFLTVDSSE